MTTIAQRSFSRGEIAPTFHGSADLDVFRDGLATLRNMKITDTGVTDRGGMKIVGEHNTAPTGVNVVSPGSRLVPFKFNTEQTYMLEFGDRFMRVNRAGAPVGFGDKTITSMAEGANAYTTVTYAGHGLADGDNIVVWGIQGNGAILNNRHYLVEVVDTDTFNILDMATKSRVNGSVDLEAPAFSGYFKKCVVIQTPWPGASLDMLRVRQRGDKLRVFCKNYPMYIISRYSDTSWTVTEATIGAVQVAPDSMTISGGSAGTGYGWAATAVSAIGEESLLSEEVTRSANGTTAAPVTVGFSITSGAVFYKIYKRVGAGGWGFAGTVPVLEGVAPSFTDNGFTPDYAQSPPFEFNPFLSTSINLQEISDTFSITVPTYAAAMHPSGLLLAVGTGSGARVYERVNLVSPWVLLSGKYATHTVGTLVADVQFSPDGNILFVSSNQSNIYVYRIVPGSSCYKDEISLGEPIRYYHPHLLSDSSKAFALVGYTYTTALPSQMYQPLVSTSVRDYGRFSFDSKYLYIKTDQTNATVMSSDVSGTYSYKAYRGPTWTAWYFSFSAVSALSAIACISLATHPNKPLLFVAYPGPKLAVVYRVGATHTLLATQPDADPVGADDVACSPDGNYLAVTAQLTNKLGWYEITGSGASTVVTALAAPADTIADTTRLRWSRDSTFLVVGEQATPFVEAYKVTVAASKSLDKVEDFASGLSALAYVNNLAWDVTGDTLMVCMESGTNLLTLHATYAYPATGALFQQRLATAWTLNDPLSINSSWVGSPFNFNRRAFPQDGDSFQFTPEDNQSNEVRHLEVLDRELIVFTMGRELSVGGNNDGGFAFGSVQSRVHGHHGSSWTEPVTVDDSILFVQNGGNIIRDLRYTQDTRSYKGNDLTAYSRHLFKNRQIIRMAYQSIPTPIIWCVLDDGTLLGLTYIKEQGVLGWHRHDTDGRVVDVACIRENDVDNVYLLVDREMDAPFAGTKRRFLEVLADTRVKEGEERYGACYVDSALVYDGRNKDAANQFTITSPTSGSSWAAGTFNVTFTTSGLFSSDTTRGNQIHLKKTDGTLLTLAITTYTSATAGIVTATESIPLEYQNVPTSEWTKAVTQLDGLFYLIGKDVSIFADGAVVSSANNPEFTTRTVSTTGICSVMGSAMGVAYVGRPYLCDMETLDIESQAPTLVNTQKHISRLSVRVEDTLGLWAGLEDPGDDTPTSKLQQVDKSRLHGLAVRSDRAYKIPYTGVLEGLVKPNWGSKGRVFIRKVDPVPCTLLSVYVPVTMEVSNG